MPRALLLFEYPTLNGGERSLLAVFPAMQRSGWEFEAIAPPMGPLAEALRHCNVALIPCEQRFIAVQPDPVSSKPSRDDLRAVLSTGPRYDLVHANSLSMGRLSGPIVAERGVPSIAHLRDIVGLKAAAVADLNCHTRLLAVSHAVRNFHAGQGVDQERLHVVYNGVDLDAWRPLASRDGVSRSAPRKTIGIIGQIILRKGQDVALAVAVDVMRTRSDVDTVVVGARHSEKLETCEYERRLHAMVAEAGMTERVRFLGTRDDVTQLLPTWSLLLHTPRQEPLGRVLLEAAACGVPVVATDVGGTREIFPRERDDGAILVPVDDVRCAVAACAEVLDDPLVAVRLTGNGRRRAEAAFSVEHAAAALLRHYIEVASGSRAAVS